MTAAPASPAPPDTREHGRRDGETITLDGRLFLKFTAFRGAGVDVRPALEAAGVQGALYVDAHDPTGIGIVAMAEDPAYFVTTLRRIFGTTPFDELEHRPEFDMLGRTYAIGYESDLRETLFERPKRRILDADLKWGVWYPLQRSKAFYRLPRDQQMRILGEHGAIGRRYGEAGLAQDIRLACHGLDRHDNDFVIGLLGSELHPLSKVVQDMRATEQTSDYLDRLGPFFVGCKIWQSNSAAAP